MGHPIAKCTGSFLIQSDISDPSGTGKGFHSEESGDEPICEGDSIVPQVQLRRLVPGHIEHLSEAKAGATGSTALDFHHLGPGGRL